jgi:FkbH-like protein
MDSLVFVDDNPIECELIRRECPECDVVIVPDKPYLLPALVEQLPAIENIRLTDEDRHKGEMYRVQAARRQHEQLHSNLDDFLASLELEVDIQPATSFSIPRIAQLTQKTNQWNMTTRRYTDAEIEAMARDPRYAVLSVTSRDRFGSDGIVGVCILQFSGSECVIDSFLLSCRVIGRGIEQLMLATAAELARRRGVHTIAAEFIPTRKNKPAEGFYARAGFPAAEGTWFRASLADVAFAPPRHIRVASSTAAQADSVGEPDAAVRTA